METDEIDRIMKADHITREFWGGCLASDQIEAIAPMKIYIVNLDKCKCQGFFFLVIEQ